MYGSVGPSLSMQPVTHRRDGADLMQSVSNKFHIGSTPTPHSGLDAVLGGLLHPNFLNAGTQHIEQQANPRVVNPYMVSYEDGAIAETRLGVDEVLLVDRRQNTLRQYKHAHATMQPENLTGLTAFNTMLRSPHGRQLYSTPAEHEGFDGGKVLDAWNFLGTQQGDTPGFRRTSQQQVLNVYVSHRCRVPNVWLDHLGRNPQLALLEGSRFYLVLRLMSDDDRSASAAARDHMARYSSMRPIQPISSKYWELTPWVGGPGSKPDSMTYICFDLDPKAAWCGGTMYIGFVTAVYGWTATAAVQHAKTQAREAIVDLTDPQGFTNAKAKLAKLPQVELQLRLK
jgi:hypothetical protein